MKFTSGISFLLLVLPLGHGFISPSPSTGPLFVLHSTPSPEEQRMKEIMAQESLNKDNLAASAERMKNMTPQDIDNMIKEMDQMPAVEREQLKKIGMDPQMMILSMQMMRDNPSMRESVGKMMENMTPEQLLAQSRVAQEKIAKLSEEATQAGIAAELSAEDEAEEDDEEKDEVEEDEEERDNDATTEDIPLENSAKDPNVIDAMFRVAEIMSQPPSGGVTFAAFATLPPITTLSGNREEDLSKNELKECWLDGSLGATRVDRQGFERVWNEVQEYFEGDIMLEARKTSVARPKKQAPVAPTTPAGPSVGATLTSDQMSAVKNMSEQDMGVMLEQIGNMTPEQQSRMKAMGVDPGMMQKTAQMMMNNPLMRKAATAMVKNMSPEQMVKTSQQAQEQMTKMSKEEYEKAMEQLSKQQGE